MNKELLEKFIDSKFVQVGDIIENFTFHSNAHTFINKDIIVTKITEKSIFIKKSNHNNKVDYTKLPHHDKQHYYHGLLNYIESVRVGKKGFYEHLYDYSSLDYHKKILRHITLMELI